MSIGPDSPAVYFPKASRTLTRITTSVRTRGPGVAPAPASPSFFPSAGGTGAVLYVPTTGIPDDW